MWEKPWENVGGICNSLCLIRWKRVQGVGGGGGIDAEVSTFFSSEADYKYLNITAKSWQKSHLSKKRAFHKCSWTTAEKVHYGKNNDSCKVESEENLKNAKTSVHRSSPSNASWFGASKSNARCKEKKKPSTKLPRFAYSWRHRLLILNYLAETEIHWNEDDKKIKQQTNFDHHGPKPLADVCHAPSRPHLFLITDYL
jgi:hypothetical protein